MCFAPDSEPPVPTISGASVDTRDLVLAAADGNRFAAFEARGSGEGGAAILILPDIRGLFSFYKDLAVRFAERGYDALAIDYFGRTAGLTARDEAFDYMPHVNLTTHEGVEADVRAAVAHLRDLGGAAVFTVGFCFGGSNSWHQAANDVGLAGAIGFYGHPDREKPTGSVSLCTRVGEMTCPILGLMGGDDPGIPPETVQKFRDALSTAGVEHEIVEYPGAPHSFFDRKYADYAAESADAWDRMLAFIDSHKG